jgi:hypothetical protein
MAGLYQSLGFSATHMLHVSGDKQIEPDGRLAFRKLCVEPLMSVVGRRNHHPAPQGCPAHLRQRLAQPRVTTTLDALEQLAPRRTRRHAVKLLAHEV